MSASRYHFTEPIDQALEGFSTYLRSEGYARASVQQMRNYAGLLLRYTEEKELEPGRLKAADLLELVHKEEYSLGHKNRILLAIRHYYRYLIHAGKATHNPASGLILQGSRRSLPAPPMAYEELLKVYERYGTTTENQPDNRKLRNRKLRNKVILGLYIFQGINTGCLSRLEPTHIDLSAASIYLPSYRKTQSRTLSLSAQQLLDMKLYLEEVRSEMLTAIEEPENLQEKLFFGQGGSLNLKNTLIPLFRSLKKRYPQLTSGKVIRASVISYWLSKYDLRQVQYMAGHRYVSSTERYDPHRLQVLSQALERFHPFVREHKDSAQHP